MTRKSLVPIQLPANPTQPLEAATKQYVDAGRPIGEITMWGASGAPVGWLLCNGQEVSRTTYASLFTVIGTIYGVGNGSTTFNVPDLTQRFPLGLGTLGAAGGDWSHQHNQTGHAHTVPDISSSGGHTHVVPNIASSGSHDHGGGTIQTNTTTGGTANRVSVVPSTSSAHTHVVNDATTSGSGHPHSISDTGLGTATANPSNGPTSAANPPYLRVGFIIRAL